MASSKSKRTVSAISETVTDCIRGMRYPLQRIDGVTMPCLSPEQIEIMSRKLYEAGFDKGFVTGAVNGTTNKRVNRVVMKSLVKIAKGMVSEDKLNTVSENMRELKDIEKSVRSLNDPKSNMSTEEIVSISSKASKRSQELAYEIDRMNMEANAHSMLRDQKLDDARGEKVFRKTPLHITWMNETMVMLEKIVSCNPELKPLLKEMLAVGTVKGCRKPESDVEVNLYHGLNLLFSVKNSQEVVIQDVKTNIDIINWNLKEAFNPPFEDMIVNLYDTNEGYSQAFMQCFKLDEDYIDPVTKVPSPVYIVKTMIKTDENVTPGSPKDYKATFEAILIKSKLPRVVYPSYISKVCRECSKANETDMMKHVYGYTHNSVRYCLKTPNSSSNCRIVDMESPFPVPDSTFAQVGFAHIKIVTEVMERLNKPPERIEKTSVERVRRERTEGKVNKYIDHEDRSYIEIKDVVTHTPKDTSIVAPRDPKGGTSPCEHLRRGHERRYKSGKVIWVDKHIVSEGNKKPIYVIKG